jgi:hypothetical protein
VPEYSFRVTERDPERPWIVVGQEAHTGSLPDDVNFLDFARETWPTPRFSVELDPEPLPDWPHSENSPRSR